MGFFDFMFEDDEDKSSKKTKRKLSDILFEPYDSHSDKPKKSFWDFLFVEDKPEIEFTNPKDVQDLADTIGGKLQDKKNELRMMGLALKQIDIKEYPGSYEITKQYLELMDKLKKLIISEDQLQEGNIMEEVSLEANYKEFENQYNEIVPRIKTLFYYKELKNQNNRMKNAFNTRSIKTISQKELDDYEGYINKIKEQQYKFSDDYHEEIVAELLKAEYRLSILYLMKDIYDNNEPTNNPFLEYNDTKKDRFAEFLFEDITEANDQYQNILNRQNLYIRTKVIDESEFENLSEEADKLNSEINNGIIDDLSLTGMFENKQYDSLKMLLKLKIDMNEIDSLYEEAQNIDLNRYMQSKKGKKGKKGKKNNNPDFSDSYGEIDI